MKKKYYLITTSTNLANADGAVVNNTLFIDGNELPSWNEIKEKVCENIKNCGYEPKKDSTIILCMVKLTKAEYDALRK